MKTVLRNVLFAGLATVGMNALDVSYHLLTSTAVHLNYVAVKFTVIFLVAFLIAQFIGKGPQEAVVSSIGGPAIFYVYYRAATPTLDRTLFVLDENVGYILVHAAALLVAYELLHAVMGLESPSRWMGNKALTAVTGILGLFYLAFSFEQIKAVGLHLELSPFGLALLGGIFLTIALGLAVSESGRAKRAFAQASLVALAVAVVEAVVHMVLRTPGLVDEMHVFSSFPYLFAVALLVFLGTRYATDSVVRDGALGIAAAVVAELVFFKAGLSASPGAAGIRGALILCAQAAVRWL